MEQKNIGGFPHGILLEISAVSSLSRVHAYELFELGSTVDDSRVRSEEVGEEASNWPGDDVLFKGGRQQPSLTKWTL